MRFRDFILMKKYLMISTHHAPLPASQPDFFKLLDNLCCLSSVAPLVTVDDLLEHPLSVGVSAEQSSLQNIQINTLVLRTTLLTKNLYLIMIH